MVKDPRLAIIKPKSSAKRTTPSSSALMDGNGIKIPKWVQSVVRGRTGGREFLAHFVAKKLLTMTDIDRNQNRLLIPSEFVGNNLLPVLTEEEKRLVGFAPRNENDGGKRGMKISVFDKNGSEFSDMALAYWESTRACIINGKDYKHVKSTWSHTNMMVHVWCFRTPTIDLRFKLSLPEVKEGDLGTLNFVVGSNDEYDDVD